MNRSPEYEDYQDYKGKMIRFKYVYLNAGNIFSLRAIEDNNKEVSREFSAYDYISQANNLYKIRQIIKRELNIRYFSDDGGEEFKDMNFGYFKGNITTDAKNEICLVVDGRKMSMVVLERVIAPHQSFEIEKKISEI